MSAFAKPEGVNRPDLLPTEKNQVVIDVANYLTKGMLFSSSLLWSPYFKFIRYCIIHNSFIGQEKKVAGAIETLQKNTGYKLRVLLQSYPNTPGNITLPGPKFTFSYAWLTSAIYL